MEKLTFMNQNIALEVLNKALSTGADFGEIFMEDTINEFIEMTKGEVTRSTTSNLYGVAIRIIKNNTTVNGSSNNLTKEGLLELASKLASSFEDKQLVFCDKFTDNTNNKNVTIKETEQDDHELELKLLKDASNGALEYAKEISQTIATITKKNQYIKVYASDGVCASDHRLNCRISITAVASDGKSMQSINENFGKNQGLEMFEGFNAYEMGKEAAKAAITMLYADEMIGGEMPVVINNGFGGVILHEACGHSLEATCVAKGMSVFCGKLGTKIASDIVNAVDCGTDENAWGSLNVDDEGTPTKCNLLIENGILKSYLVDKKNSKKMNHPITGSARRESYKFMPTSRMTNTYFLNGNSTFDEIISSIKYGLFAKSMGGGSVLPATGEFNFAVNEGYLIEDGKITKPVKGATLVGSGKDILLRIEMVANNLSCGHGMCGSMSGSIPANVGQPTIKVSHITVGGKGVK